MTTLLSELVRSLSEAAAREIRSRAEDLPFTRAELAALATLHDMAAASLAAGALPESLVDATTLSALEEVSRFDLRIVERARSQRAR